MESIRQLQVAELIKRNFSMLLQSEGSYIYGPGILVTVTNVKMSPDLSGARIYLSIFNTENKQEVILHLEDEITHLRQGLGRRIKNHVRRIPEISFFIDDTLDEMYQVNKLFNRLEEEGQMGKSEEEE